MVKFFGMEDFSRPRYTKYSGYELYLWMERHPNLSVLSNKIHYRIAIREAAC